MPEFHCLDDNVGARSAFSDENIVCHDWMNHSINVSSSKAGTDTDGSPRPLWFKNVTSFNMHILTRFARPEYLPSRLFGPREYTSERWSVLLCVVGFYYVYMCDWWR